MRDESGVWKIALGAIRKCRLITAYIVGRPHSCYVYRPYRNIWKRFLYARPTPDASTLCNLPLYPDMRNYDCRMISSVIIQTMHTKQLKHYKREFASSVLKFSGREKRKKEIMNDNWTCDLRVNEVMYKCVM